MRPVRLEIEGFTCYREKQEIDFSRLHLFAIAGPTGAGKSSILDAITFALFGVIPRMGSQNLTEFISLGAARAVVTFEFDFNGDRFRLVRSMPRSGQKKAQLEQIVSGGLRPVCDGADKVTAEIQSKLCLDYKAFSQSVLLPQGDFAKFLKGTRGDQLKILRDLLRLGIYESMRKRAFAQAEQLSAALETDRKRLEEDYSDATPQNVAGMEGELKAWEVEKDIAQKTRDELRLSLAIVESQWKLVEERETRKTLVRKLVGDRPRIEDLTIGVARAKNAAQVLPILDQAAAKLRALESAESEYNGFSRDAKSLSQAVQDCEEKLEELQRRASELPAKRLRAMALGAIQPVLRERDSLAVALEEARAELSKSQKAVEAGEIKLKQAEKAACEARELFELRKKERVEIGYDISVHTIFKKARIPAHDLADARRQVSAFDPDAAQTAVRNAEAALASAQQDFDAAEAKRISTDQQFRDAQAGLDAAQDQHKAASLRSGLTAGCTCPVCDQEVHNIPPLQPPADLEKAKSVVVKARKDADAAASRATAARDQFNRAQTDAEHAQRNAAEWEEAAANWRRKVEEYTVALVAATKPFDCQAGVLIDQFVEQEFDRFERLHSQWQEASEKVTLAELLAEKAEAASAAAKVTVETEEATRLRVSGQIAGGEEKFRDYERQISVVGSPDPDAELESLQKEIEQIDNDHKRATDIFQQAKTKAHEVELKLTGSLARLSSALTERDNSRTAAESALSRANFVDESEVKKASMSPELIALTENEISTFERNLSQTLTRIQELDKDLDGITLTEADLKCAAENARTAEEAFIELVDKVGKRTDKLENLKRETEKAEALRLEHQQRKARHALIYRLSQDLKSDGFQQYLLEGSFRKLVAGASSRLKELNERYELAYSDGQFTVIDHDHGSLSRLADTLSGGETFLVSLALALELSEQVQKAAGAVRLDSLFIDEGFGTLDPETLDTVADAIESLSKTNRMVGIITHVAELHRRLPRLEVRPTAAGSVVQYVED